MKSRVQREGGKETVREGRDREGGKEIGKGLLTFSGAVSRKVPG